MCCSVRFFRSCNCVVQWQTKYHDEGKSAWFFCNARHHRRSHVKKMEGFLGQCRKGLCLGRCRMIRIVREARRSSQTETYWLFFNVRHHRRSNVLESQLVICICCLASVPPLPVWHAAGMVQTQLSAVYISSAMSLLERCNGLCFRLL